MTKWDGGIYGMRWGQKKPRKTLAGVKKARQEKMGRRPAWK
jgi:hypothetical protein